MKGIYMKIEKIKAFIDLYNCGSYTKTAKINYISQTSITQYINSLEEEFNIQLFDRSVIPVKPTSAGELFYKEAKLIYEQYLKMQEVMASFHNKQSIPLKIAYTSVVEAQMILPYIMTFKKKYPHINLIFKQVLMKDLANALHAGVYDIVITIDSEFDKENDIETYSLYSGYYNAIVSSNHPLYDKSEITNEQLYKYPLIMLDKNIIGKSYDKMIEKSQKDGYFPIIQKTAHDFDSEMIQIIVDDLIGFIPDNYKLNDFSLELRKIPIKDSTHTFQIELGYLKSNHNESISLLLDIIRK